MTKQETKSRLQKLIEESKAELADSINSATTYENWKDISQQIDEIIAAINGLEILEKLLKDEPEEKTE